MKLLYCIHSTFNSGGMERVLANKANYLAKKGYEITIATTEQGGKLPFYALDDSIKSIDLRINYASDNNKGVITKGVNYFIKKQRHKVRLSKLINEIQPDIVISMFGNESSFLCDIKDGSKKILEIHFSRYFRNQYERKGIWRLIDSFRNKQDEFFARNFDSFIVLTHEDKKYWGELNNITVIPNAAINLSDDKASLDRHSLIAVGRLTYQKGYDRLVHSWKIVHDIYPNWNLDIYGSGELHNDLTSLIEELGLSECVRIFNPINDIVNAYLEHSALILSSRYEGLPMVILEAMSCGLPIIAYTCKCGPKDVISNGIDGFLVEEGNIEDLANKIVQIIENTDLRKSMGVNAIEKSRLYSEEIIMEKWLSLFDYLLNK